MTHRKKVIRNRIILGSIIGMLAIGGLFFLAARETHISREFVTECDTRAIRW